MRALEPTAGHIGDSHVCFARVKSDGDDRVDGDDVAGERKHREGVCLNEPAHL